jgi:hypothetical protein
MFNWIWGSKMYGTVVMTLTKSGKLFGESKDFIKGAVGAFIPDSIPAKIESVRGASGKLFTEKIIKPEINDRIEKK